VADVYASLGTAYLDAGRVEEALDALGKGIRLDASRPEIRLQLARAYRSLGRLAEAEEHLMLAMPTGDTAAPTASRQQLESDLYLEQGLIRRQQGQLDAAAAALRRSIQMDSSRGPVHRHLAEVYLELGAYDQAARHAALAESLGSPLPDVQRQSLRDALIAPARRGR
jgi:tetratricopeptide (TPR) repeat protein